jgi:hypothetical protein
MNVVYMRLPNYRFLNDNQYIMPSLPPALREKIWAVLYTYTYTFLNDALLSLYMMQLAIIGRYLINSSLRLTTRQYDPCQPNGHRVHQIQVDVFQRQTANGALA